MLRSALVLYGLINCYTAPTSVPLRTFARRMEGSSISCATVRLIFQALLMLLERQAVIWKCYIIGKSPAQ